MLIDFSTKDPIFPRLLLSSAVHRRHVVIDRCHLRPVYFCHPRVSGAFSLRVGANNGMIIELLLRVGIRPVHVSLEPLRIVLSDSFIVLAHANKHTLQGEQETVGPPRTWLQQLDNSDATESWFMW